MLFDQVWMKKHGPKVVLSILAFFVVTTLVLHAGLSEIDDEDLLSRTSDWRQASVQQLRQVVSSVRGKILPPPLGKNNVSSAPLPPVVEGKNNKLNKNKKTARQIYDESHHPFGHDMTKVQAAVQALRKPMPATQLNMTYDIFACPEEPPPNYPASWNLPGQVLRDWNPDVTEMPDRIYQGLCVFDWETDYDKALAYRQAEVPFIVQNQPQLLQAAQRWSTDGYLQQLIGEIPQRNEHSLNNHFMFWRTRNLRSVPSDWTAPTDETQLSYKQWLRKAQALERSSSNNKKNSHTTQEHWYLRLNADYKNQLNSYVYDELPIFKPDAPGFFMVEPEQERGINCRFGMKGVIAEAHFDPTRNFVVLLGGQRRYILAHPDQCEHLELYDLDHPSGRHSKVNWSDPPHVGPFAHAMVNEVVLQAADALYLPTAWFHFIVSLNINYQCNARSGMTYENLHYLHECGFGGGKAK